MIHKLFPLDKNYVLKKAQADTETFLLNILVKECISSYLEQNNPLGLEDDTVIRIKSCNEYNLEPLVQFYHELAGIYRFKFNETQLELLFDGRSHYEKYQQEWKETFYSWLQEFCKQNNFIRAVLECAVICPEDKIARLVQARMKYFLTKNFEMKVYRYKGIQEVKIA